MSTLKVGALQGISASSDAITLANDGTCTANITNNLSNRNKVINGAMQVIQRGASTVAGSHNSFAVDRFKFKKESTAANFNLTQSSISPDGFSKSLKLDVTTVDNSTASDEFVVLRHAIEAQDLQELGYGTAAAKPLVLSFYVRSNVTGTYGINCLQIDNSSKIYSRTYTINSVDTWERKTISIPADTSGVINDDNGEGLQINFNLLLGSNFKGSAVSSAWETYANDKWGSQHGVNIAHSISNNWYLTGVQLEVDHTGSGVATDFEHRSFAQELALCQRYFYMHTDAQTNSGAEAIGTGTWYNAYNLFVSVHFPTTMRTVPSLYQVSGTDYFQFNASNTTSGFDSFNEIWRSNKNMAYLGEYNESNTTGASAMVQTNNSNARLGFNAEL